MFMISRSKFLIHVPAGGDILDAGCGSGRDALAFHRAGYRVTAFDASPEMCRMARQYTDLPVIQMTFQEMTWRSAFDGIWACASLLHVPQVELPDVLGTLFVLFGLTAYFTRPLSMVARTRC